MKLSAEFEITRLELIRELDPDWWRLLTSEDRDDRAAHNLRRALARDPLVGWLQNCLSVLGGRAAKERCEFSV